jgi:DNA-directed RNA polymerase subunit H (RpoH/RPB5)
MPHILQPKQTIIKAQEAEKILLKLNISLSQLPKIHLADAGLPKGAVVGDVVKIERKDDEGVHEYFRVVIL